MLDKKFPAWIVFLGGFLVGVWGVLHLSFTESVAKSYNHLPAHLLKVFRTEWIIEGLFLLFICILVFSLYPHLKRKSRVARTVGFYCGAILVVLAVWHIAGPSLNGLSYKLYIPILVLSALLIWLPLIFHKGEWN